MEFNLTENNQKNEKLQTLFKKGPKTESKYYKRFSLSPFVSKVMEETNSNEDYVNIRIKSK